MKLKRVCDRCSKPYWRVQRFHIWTTQNYGHRAGWALAEQRVCTKCMDQSEARTLFTEILPKWRKP